MKLWLKAGDFWVALGFSPDAKMDYSTFPALRCVALPVSRYLLTSTKLQSTAR